MTSKFSQGAATQTLPPVCRYSAPPPIIDDLPLYPDLHGFCEFGIRRYDGEITSGTTDLRLTWQSHTNRWIQGIVADDFTIFVYVQPEPYNTRVKIYTEILVPDAQFYVQTWYAPHYVPSAYWESGENLTYGWDRITYAWQTFATYH